MTEVRVQATALASRRPLLKKRLVRWAYFQVMLLFLYVGVVFDIVTTAQGYTRLGSAYEQNPICAYLIAHLGWMGLLGAMTVLCGVFYISCKRIYQKGPGYWGFIFNMVLTVAVLVRWTIVALALAYLGATQA